MPSAKSQSSGERFRVTRVQYVLLLAALASLISVGYTTIHESSVAIRQSKVLSDVETPAATIIFTQRETLVYSTRLAQWSNGGTTRRTVQIARNILAQRLAVVDSSGESMGSRAPIGYWEALQKADAIVASTVPGILPENRHPEINALVSPVIDEILREARNLVVTYQKSIDKGLQDNARQTAEAEKRLLGFFLLFLFFSALFLFTNIRTNFRIYQQAKIALKEERRQLEVTIEKLRQTQDTVSKLRDLDQTKNAFIATVNHELRTPLTSIIGYIEIIQDEIDKLDPKIAEYLDVLDRNAQILLNLVESMLSLSKIDAAQGVVSEEKISLVEVINNTIFVMRPSFERAGIEVEFAMPDGDLFSVQGNQGQLSQVFLNLLGNAIKFSADGSVIKIALSHRVEAGNSMIDISIQDYGIGIPAEDLENLYSRFFRATNAVAQQIQGTGLGLSIVKQVLDLHKATIKVDSKVGVGTTFTLTFPSHLSDDEKIIAGRREDVLRRTISRLLSTTPESLKADTHELGGTIGFYGNIQEGESLLEISRSSDLSADEVSLKLEAVISTLKSQLVTLENGGNGNR